jgi:hypothetical protein
MKWSLRDLFMAENMKGRLPDFVTVNEDSITPRIQELAFGSCLLPCKTRKHSYEL